MDSRNWQWKITVLNSGALCELGVIKLSGHFLRTLLSYKHWGLLISHTTIPTLVCPVKFLQKQRSAKWVAGIIPFYLSAELRPRLTEGWIPDCVSSLQSKQTYMCLILRPHKDLMWHLSKHVPKTCVWALLRAYNLLTERGRELGSWPAEVLKWIVQGFRALRSE